MFNQSDELSQMFLLTFACVALTSPDSLTRVPLGVQRRAAERNELSLYNDMWSYYCGGTRWGMREAGWKHG